ncbi:hypothetical protein [Flavobacterium sp.]|uniref:hypothetical protein n=1 Tax=Flavobacterium sp. TaxID=239 RepID=UPI003528AF70
MSKLKHEENLGVELLSHDITEKRFLEIRNELLQIVFNYKNANVFDSLILWNNFLKVRLEDNKINIERPGNQEGVTAILSVIRQLSSESI